MLPSGFDFWAIGQAMLDLRDENQTEKEVVVSMAVWHIGRMTKCPAHPTYRALREPRADCPTCRCMRRNVLRALRQEIVAEEYRMDKRASDSYRKEEQCRSSK